MRYIGKGLDKVDSKFIATGKALYTDDIALNNKNVLELKILRSPYAYANIKNIDVSKALKLKGVHYVFTYEDVPNIKYTGAGQTYPEPSPYDRLILDKTVRYVGDEVAIIVADNEKIASKAMKLIKVDYEVLEPVLDHKTASENPIRVHKDDPHFNIPKDIGNYNVSKNIVGAIDAKFGGDLEEAFSNSDLIIEEEYDTQAQAQSMMENFSTYTYLDDRERLVIVSSTQVPFHIKRQVSHALGIAYNKVRVIKPRVGGGFGAKQTLCAEFYPAFVTYKTGKACKLIYNRKESMTASNSRHAMNLKVKLGAKKDGTINAININAISDQGAYGTHAWTTLGLVGEKSIPLYNKIDAARFEAKVVYTNKMPAGAFRGYGATQGSFALESTVNTLAKKLNMDPTELRMKNIIKEGEKTLAYNKNILSCTLDKCIERGKELIEWDKYYPFKEVDDDHVLSVGMSISMQGSGIANLDVSTVEARLNEDGDYTLFMSQTDVGTGADTITVQMAAQVLDTDMENINSIIADTDLTPYDPGSYASSGTYVTGMAVVKACENLKAKILDIAAGLLELDKKDLDLLNDYIVDSKGNKKISLRDLAIKYTATPSGKTISATGSFGSPTSPPPYMAGFVLLNIDKKTGKVKVEKYVAVVDCGTVVNPNLAKVQVEGGIVQGIGLALYEDINYSSDGKIINNNFMQYKIPVREDIGDIIVEFIESYEPSGPFGAKSIGEIVINTPSSAINAAIENISKKALTSLPFTPEKVWRNLNIIK